MQDQLHFLGIAKTEALTEVTRSRNPEYTNI